MALPIIPETITVHLGRPDEPARNVTVPFTEYIKNVASSEIYPTWPESAIRANILAQISYTLNRVYTEYYRSRGYDFDVTNTTQYDHYFVEGRDVFENISRIVDDIFNNYLVREGNVQPFFAQYCDGVRSTCAGLSQWGTVELANQGLTPFEILRYYYGNDINIVYNAQVGRNIPSYPGSAIRRGFFGEDVITIKRQLNRIAKNYPAIPVIQNLNGAYDLETENAVRAFQRIFNLTEDGIVGKATWYKLKEVYAGVKGLSELTSEGLTIAETQRQFPEALVIGDTGGGVSILQYYLAFLGYFLPNLPPIEITGVFDQQTQDAVFTFQSEYGLDIDGSVGRETWNRLQQAYNQIVNDLPANYQEFIREPYPGRFLNFGDSGNDVRTLQIYLDKIAKNDPQIPLITVNGNFDEATRQAVIALQRQLGFEQNGSVGPVLWSEIITRGSGF